jgi:hypothetical protein
MKNLAPRRPLLGAAALLLALTLVPAVPSRAQSAAKPGAPPAQTQYTQDELELLRGRLLEMVDTVREFSDAVSPNDARSAESLTQSRERVLKLTAQELNAFRATLDPSKMNADLPWAHAVLEDFKPALSRMNRREFTSPSFKGGATASASAGFPGVEAPDAVCDALVGAGRPSSDLMMAADAVYVAAKVINAVADRACNQVVVAGVIVLGEGAVGGGNTSSACIAADALLFVAENVHDKLESCDDDFTKRSIDAAVGRLAHLHADVEAGVANDNANKTAVISNDNTNKASIVANDNANKDAVIANAESNKSAVFSKIGDSAAAIIANDDANKAAVVANDNANKNTIVNNDNANKNTIVANDNANRAAIIANDNANATMLRDLLLRTQIEADLSATDGNVPVALFETPETVCAGAAPLNQCGLLGLVRTIVVQTIARLAGSSAAQANSFLAKGDQYAAAGNYKAAYQQYRAAYKAAAK